MKKFLFLAVAALGFAACSEKGLENSDPNGELEQSYVAITLAADDMGTRAGEQGNYEVGRDEERAVKSAYVLFFRDGQPFHVSFDGTTSVNGGPNNYLPVKLTDTNQDGMDNISDIKNAVLVLQNYKGEYPNQILALLNWTPTLAEYSLDQLRTNTPLPGSDDKGYMMSNSVYKDGNNKVVDVTPLTIDKIFKNQGDALSNPVTINVERVAAKVMLVNGEDNRVFPVGKTVTDKDGNEIEVYAKILDWELYNDIDRSYLIKSLEGHENWTGEEFGFTNWNNPEWRRSYWATSLGADKLNKSFSWENTAMTPYVYVGENTNKWTETNDTRTKIIVKAQLVQADKVTPVEVVNWYGKDYVTEDELLRVVANTLNNTYYFSEVANTYEGVKPEDLVCTRRNVNEENAFEVYFQLKSAAGVGVEKTWYKKNADGTYTQMSDAEFNAILAAVQPALVYNDGMTYYWTDIKHLGAKNSTTEFGIVRNHVYKVNITEIKGFGTPVYDETVDFITPDKPENITTYVSAQINILSWRIVEENYQLGE